MTPAEALEQVRALHAEHRWSTEGNSRFREGMVAILDAVTPDAPVTVETVEGLLDLFQDPVWFDVAVQDAHGRLWIVWENDHGDYFATSQPYEDDDPRMALARSVADIALPATVLTPATPERTEQGREAAVERVAEAICGADPSHLSRWPLEAERRFCGVCWEKAPSVIAAYEGREVSE